MLERPVDHGVAEGKMNPQQVGRAGNYMLPRRFIGGAATPQCHVVPDVRYANTARTSGPLPRESHERALLHGIGLRRDGRWQYA